MDVAAIKEWLLAVDDAAMARHWFWFSFSFQASDSRQINA
jgi:hypothetical protein